MTMHPRKIVGFNLERKMRLAWNPSGPHLGPLGQGRSGRYSKRPPSLSSRSVSDPSRAIRVRDKMKGKRCREPRRAGILARL